MIERPALEALAPVVNDADYASLQAAFRGPVLRPGDDAYDEVRRVWNAMIDRRPAFIARCLGAADVRAALRFARDRNLTVSVRGGGHNVGGTAVAEGGVMIDLSLMRSERVDPTRRTVRVEPGVRLGELDAETQAFGLAVPAGIVTDTGVAGLTLGGGFGWLSRAYGLTCDNLLSADVVLADGELVRASADENAELFWGLRGGGGNFGIVTSFEFRAQRVGPEVLAGPVVYSLEDAPAVLRAYRDWAASAPDEVTTIVGLRTVPAVATMPSRLHGRRVVAVTACHVGEPARAERDVESLRHLGSPLHDGLARQPFRQLQAMFDASVPSGWRYYWKSEFLRAIDDQAIDVMIEAADTATQPRPYLLLFQLGGAIARLPADAAAYEDRGAAFALNINGVFTDPAEEDSMVSWVRRTWERIQPSSTGRVYVNFIGAEGEERVRYAYGPEKYARLVVVKDRYDPENVFRMNQNVRPSARGSSG